MLDAFITPETLLFALALRGMPLLAYGLLARRGSKAARALLGAGYGAVVAPLLASAEGRRLLLFTAAGLAYYALVGCGVYALSPLLRARRVTEGAVFSIMAFAALGLPALAAQEIAAATFLTFGCDLMLSGYSYCVEVAPGDTRPPLGEALFFLLVNPALVFTARGGPIEGPESAVQPALRLVLGLFAFCSGMVLLAALARSGLLAAWVPGPVGAAATYGVLRFLSEYALQSGLASIQIAILRLFGQRVPEGYDYPFLARDPRDLWRRWNRYVGTWLQRYAFTPAARRLSRAGLRGGSAAPFAVLATFGASAALHSAYSYAGSFSFDAAAVSFLLANGVAVALWPVLGRALAQARTRGAGLPPATILSRLGFAAGVIAAVATWG